MLIPARRNGIPEATTSTAWSEDSIVYQTMISIRSSGIVWNQKRLSTIEVLLVTISSNYVTQV